MKAIEDRTNAELFEIAIAKKATMATRIKAQDLLSRRAYYDEDEEASAFLGHGRPKEVST